jgi:hypothetical protein
MTAVRAIKIASAWSAGIAILMSASYCSEASKYRFERLTAETGQRIPGARLIGSIMTGDLASPVSWFWPATTTWNFASPDPVMRDRFYQVSLMYDQENPDVFLLDVDCAARNGEWYDLGRSFYI